MKNKVKQVKPKKQKKPVRYVPINENKEYEKVVLILKKETIQQVIKTIANPLS